MNRNKWRWVVMGIALAAAGCEAPLNLQGVAKEAAKPLHRFDHLKGMAQGPNAYVAVADFGVLVHSPNGKIEPKRVELPTRASLLNVTACPSGRFLALDSRKHLWLSDEQAEQWRSIPVETEETLMGLACGPDDQFWVGGSFSTILSSKDQGSSWQATTQDEDFLISNIQVLPDGGMIAAGEFGTVMTKTGADEAWERMEPVPNDFYPLGAYFRSLKEGWLSGLSGAIYHTADGGQTWQLEPSETDRPLYNFIPLGDRLFVVGDNGTLLERGAGRWGRVAGAPDVATYLIAGVPSDKTGLIVAGGGGHLDKVTLPGKEKSL